ncbi:DUF92 domain-containing protein [Paenibacillus sp. 481]|uniref:DUF92 domain-containing protein n=1 Tax=Paenibacillus sp. 481 TaxID=2835869 RepID=UPI001E4E8789|nr:DUF92 domain-containing protein [Paenibacillus sp. 481]UHA76165.1 DUF92 domain-containing protein [Paenibacillus sp. 481]
MTMWLAGLLGSLLVAGAALLKRSLTLSGAVAASVMGTIYFGSGSLIWFGLLLTFFITSTLWSKWKKRMKSRLDDVYEKSGARDAGQVFANGGIGMVLCLGHALFPHSSWLWVFVGVMATVNADTWATEIGSLSRKLPRSILSGQQVPAGTSGAVSGLGSLAAVGGALTVGVAGALFTLLSPEPYLTASVYELLALITAGLVGGVIGAFTDSLLGATAQAGYRCNTCDVFTERRAHCGQPTTLVRGFAWLNNDLVNLISSCAGGAAAWLCALLFGLV